MRLVTVLTASFLVFLAVVWPHRALAQVVIEEKVDVSGESSKGGVERRATAGLRASGGKTTYFTASASGELQIMYSEIMLGTLHPPLLVEVETPREVVRDEVTTHAKREYYYPDFCCYGGYYWGFCLEGLYMYYYYYAEESYHTLVDVEKGDRVGVTVIASGEKNASRVGEVTEDPGGELNLRTFNSTGKVDTFGTANEFYGGETCTQECYDLKGTIRLLKGEEEEVDEPTRYAQNNSAWADSTYDHTSSDIGKLGCALSTLAMAASYYGYEVSPLGLNNWMKTWTNPDTGEQERRPYKTTDGGWKNRGGFTSEGGVNWWAVRLFADEQLTVSRKGSDLIESGTYYWDKAQDPSKIDRHLSEGRLVAVQVFNAQSKARGATGQHWVLVYNKTEDGRYEIKDPGRGSKYLDAYGSGGEKSPYGKNRFWGFVPIGRAN